MQHLQVVQPIEEDAHRSRWGYHVCSYDTYSKLKYLQGIYWDSVRLEAATERYYRKHSHNRVHRVYRRDAKGRRCGVIKTFYAAPPRAPVIASKEIKFCRKLFCRAKKPFESIKFLKLSQWEIKPGMVQQINALYRLLGGKS